jgi:DNA-directed RNA polymerase sigma subunit (sigma70/sigma32)
MSAKIIPGMEPVRTFKEIGKILKCSDTAAQNVHDRALAKLRRMIIDRKLTEDDFRDYLRGGGVEGGE